MSRPDTRFMDRPADECNAASTAKEAPDDGRSRLAAEALSEFNGLLATYVARAGETEEKRPDAAPDGDQTALLLLALDEDEGEDLLLIGESAFPRAVPVASGSMNLLG